MLNARGIKEKARELGIEVRITDAQPFFEEETKIKRQLQEGLFLKKTWQEDEVKRFCNPSSVLQNAKSIISSFLFYLTDEEDDPSTPADPYGLIARYTQRNYYKELKNRLKKLGNFLKKEYQAKFVTHSCGPICEKPIARRSGLGYYGKHSIIINHHYGSWIVLGEIITDLEIECDEPIKVDCGLCQKCIDACPTRAIISPYIIDRKGCIQALTAKDTIILDEIAAVWGNRLYGCTTCQDVCPINKKIKPEPPKTELGIVGEFLPLIEILKMDELSYRQRYKDNQISSGWVSFNAIRRNALLALGNIRDRKTIPIIKRFTKEKNWILKKTAEWALRQY